MDPRSPRGVTFEKFLRAFELSWRAIERSIKKAPNVIVVGVDKAAENVRRCLSKLDLEAHVIVDVEMSPTALVITHTDDLAQMPGTARHPEHGHVLGGGKN